MKSIEELTKDLSMTEIIRLQDALSSVIAQRYEKRVALVFCDVVGSTAYTLQFGDEAGRKLQQRHLDLALAASTTTGGRLVDAAGDGLFLCFPGANAAVRAMMALQCAILKDNAARSAEHRLRVRVGVHEGPVLTDGVLVTGDSVNFCSHFAATAGADELRLSAAAHAALTDTALSRRCRHLDDVEVKGVGRPQEAFVLDWRDPVLFPSRVRFPDGSGALLPNQDVIRFGRMAGASGHVANDIVINTPDAGLQTRISRWHFELHRHPEGYHLRSLTTGSTTEVNGRMLAPEESMRLVPGAKVRLGGVVMLEFVADESSEDTTRVPG